MEIRFLIPQSKLVAIQGLVEQFNKALKRDGLPFGVQVAVGEAFLGDWYVTHRTWLARSMAWRDKGVKEQVKLHPVSLSVTKCVVEGWAPSGFIDTSYSKVDPLLNELINCRVISFGPDTVPAEIVSRAIDIKHNVSCDHCSVERSRKRCFVGEKEGSPFFYGPRCLEKEVGLTTLQIVKWSAFYKQRFDQLCRDIKRDSRIIILAGAADIDRVSVEAFFHAVYAEVSQNRQFIAAKGVLPTHTEALKSIKSGAVMHGASFEKFRDYVFALKANSHFLKMSKGKFIKALKAGVNESNSAVLAGLVSVYLKGFWHLEGVPPAKDGFYCGYFYVRSQVFVGDSEGVELEDAWGRLFQGPATEAIKPGALVFAGGMLSDKQTFKESYPVQLFESVKLFHV